jgi:hypothetical protein
LLGVVEGHQGQRIWFHHTIQTHRFHPLLPRVFHILLMVWFGLFLEGSGQYRESPKFGRDTAMDVSNILAELKAEREQN